MVGARKPVKRKRVARGFAEAPVGYVRTRDAFGASFELHCPDPHIAKRKYLALRVAHILFPENFPKAVGLSGKVVHMKYVPPHKELRDFQRKAVELQETKSKPSGYDEAVMSLYGGLHAKNRGRIDSMSNLLTSKGIRVDTAPPNVSIRKGKMVFYDVKLDPAKVKRELKRLPLNESKKRTIERYLKQYDELMME